MNISNSHIGNTASEPEISNSDSEASIGQLISSDLVTTSQPQMDLTMPNIIRSQALWISDQSRVEILLRQRTARRRRRRRRAQRRWQQRVQNEQLAHQIRYRQMANQHFQQQQDHRYNQGEEQEKEEQQDRDHHNQSPSRSSPCYDLFAEVMDDRLLEMYDWETLSQENQQEQVQLFELDTTTAMEHLVLVQDNGEPSPEIHTLAFSERSQQHHETQMAEEYNQPPLNNIQTNSTPHSFDSIFFSIEPMEAQQQATAPSFEKSQQRETTKEHSSYGKKNSDN